MSQKSSGEFSGYSPGTASAAGAGTPAWVKRPLSASGVVISSHGFQDLYRDGSASRTADQKTELPGSHRSGPQVVIARVPPGRTRRHISATKAPLSGTKNTPNTQITASKLAPGRPVLVASPRRNSAWGRAAARSRARASSGSAASIPMTWPEGPTARAAGMADAPAP